MAGWWLLSISGIVQPAHYLPTPAATLSAGLRHGPSRVNCCTTRWPMTAGADRASGWPSPCRCRWASSWAASAAGWALFEPVIGLLRYLPAAAFIPLLIIWLGLGEEPKVALIFLGTFFFNTLMTADVVRGVPWHSSTCRTRSARAP